MLNLLNWSSKIRVNGEVFDNSDDAYEKFKDFEGNLKVELNFVEPLIRPIGVIEIKEGVYYF